MKITGNGRPSFSAAIDASTSTSSMFMVSQSFSGGSSGFSPSSSSEIVGSGLTRYSLSNLTSTMSAPAKLARAASSVISSTVVPSSATHTFGSAMLSATFPSSLTVAILNTNQIIANSSDFDIIRTLFLSPNRHFLDGVLSMFIYPLWHHLN